MVQQWKNNETYLELPSLNVIQDVITRWNSVLAMLRRLIKIRTSVNMTVLECGQPELVITEDEISKMVNIIDPNIYCRYEEEYAS